MSRSTGLDQVVGVGAGTQPEDRRDAVERIAGELQRGKRVVDRRRLGIAGDRLDLGSCAASAASNTGANRIVDSCRNRAGRAARSSGSAGVAKGRWMRVMHVWILWADGLLGSAADVGGRNVPQPA